MGITLPSKNGDRIASFPKPGTFFSAAVSKPDIMQGDGGNGTVGWHTAMNSLPQAIVDRVSNL